ncbi:alpha-1,6-mannosyltransferas-like protein subunit [Delitschia confertaspora ATCC 74209]|uniref:Alpha-1,6-mannosyltransferas-like protein subunit n=1 Tax=Delitschia confertaspora ATCC 74209 TaxID=1513339 RepID=A0A9P4JPL5_9PLEO|nr:alpha-1,6-mannosyltransferas-like protein subunit [Delitschia confertaspora ATCC 74209]
MHFAMPPRKTSRPPPYAVRNARSSFNPQYLIPRDRLRRVVLAILGFLAAVWTLRWMFGGGGEIGYESAVAGSGAPVVIVTVFDEKADKGWVGRVKRNREEYARRHGYATFFNTTSNYNIKTSPLSWSKVPALRHAMTLHPTSTWFWYLDSTALIANPSVPITSHILSPAKLEKHMIVNEPVVPPDSVIKTFANLKGERIDVVVTQDREGLSVESFAVRRGEWAKYFLDAWFDPIYRNYNFQKAEGHALEHIVQWHGTILAKLALVPQSLINSYAKGADPSQQGHYKSGDLVASFPGCDKGGKRSCDEEMKPYFEEIEKRKGAE